MEKQKLNVVWLKRDLRSQDHLPFFLAEKEESPFIALYLYEPDLMISADNSQRHWRFCYQSVIDLNQSFSKTNKKVEVMFATARDAFSYLLESYDLKKVFSYQESGTERTWLRDLKLNQLFLSKNEKWVECQRDGVQRGRKDRKDWDKHWYIHANLKIINNTFNHLRSIDDHPFHLSKDLYTKLERRTE